MRCKCFLVFATLSVLLWGLFSSGRRSNLGTKLLPPRQVQDDDATVDSLLGRLVDTTKREPAPTTEDPNAPLAEIEQPLEVINKDRKYNNPSSVVGFPGNQRLVREVVDENIFRELPDPTVLGSLNRRMPPLLNDYGDWSRIFGGNSSHAFDGKPLPTDYARNRHGDAFKAIRTYEQRKARRLGLSVNRLTKLLRLLYAAASSSPTGGGGDAEAQLLLAPTKAKRTIVRFAWCMRAASSLWRSAGDGADAADGRSSSLSFFLKSGDGRQCSDVRRRVLEQCQSFFLPSVVQRLASVFYGANGMTEAWPLRNIAATSAAAGDDAATLQVLRRVFTPIDAHTEMQRLVNESLRFSPRKLPLSRVNLSQFPAMALRKGELMRLAAAHGGGLPSVTQVLMAPVARKQEYAGEAVCDFVGDRESGQPENMFHGASWGSEAYRLSLLMDAVDVLEMYASDRDFAEEEAEGSSPQQGRGEELRIAALLDPAHPSLACMVSATNPVVEFGRRTRWMLDAHKPFAGEMALVGPNHDPVSFKRRPPMYKDDRPITNDEFDIVANRFVPGKKSFYTIKNLCGPIFYELRNVCLSPDGHGMSGFDANGRPGSPEELRDERRQKIRGVRVAQRLTRPKYFVDRPLVLHLVQFQSNNLGHVMYRLNMLANFVRNHLSENRTFESLANDEEVLLGLYVVPSALDTFGPFNSYKLYYQALELTWFSVAALNSSRRSAEEEERDLCFRRAYLGHETAYMYHSKGGPGMAQKKIREAAGISQALVARGLTNIRNRLLSCHGMAFALDSGPENPFAFRLKSPPSPLQAHQTGPLLGTPASLPPWHIVVIVRSQRRIANQDILLALLALYMGVPVAGGPAPSSSVTLMDPTTRRPVRVTVADYESLLPRQQLELTSSAHVLLAVHGTALQWMISMQPGGVVIEFQFGGLGCVEGFINHDLTRILCEFGKTSLASGLSHMAVRYARPDSIFIGPSPTNWDVVVDPRQFIEVMASAMCLLEKGPRGGSRGCWPALNTSLL
jgi:hypothetical protein